MPILSVHQPHFFPWAPYFLKISQSDVFILLDDVQFRKNYFQNRCEIATALGCEKKWLSVPIKKNISSKSKINEVLISEKFQEDEALSLIRLSYGNAPFFDQVYPDLQELFSSKDTHLCDINIRGILWCLKVLRIRTKILVSSQLNLPLVDNPTMRLVNMCIYIEMNQYLSGPGGRDYMDLTLFTDNNIDVLWYESDKNSFEYRQPAESFLPGLSILDMFFHIGYEGSSKLLDSQLI
jgi:hypothetical protein